jgi:metal-responsive CopG/Arc/MetJ family transcriptional regulator
LTEPQARSNPERRRIGSTFTDDELDAIDQWGFARRIRDRSETIRRLVEEGLKTKTATSELAGSN